MHAAAAAAKSLQSCPTLCDPIDGSSPGSPIPGILQANSSVCWFPAFPNTQVQGRCGDWNSKIMVPQPRLSAPSLCCFPVRLHASTSDRHPEAKPSQPSPSGDPRSWAPAWSYCRWSLGHTEAELGPSSPRLAMLHTVAEVS